VSFAPPHHQHTTLPLSNETLASRAHADAAPERCSELSKLAMQTTVLQKQAMSSEVAIGVLYPECNRCSYAYDHSCEVTEPQESSLCAPGTDTFDCELQRQVAKIEEGDIFLRASLSP
jgi:hypothetical protein